MKKIAIIGIMGMAGYYLAFRAYTYLRYLNEPCSQSFMQWATESAADQANLITLQHQTYRRSPLHPADRRLHWLSV